jgi:hypothetical protein
MKTYLNEEWKIFIYSPLFSYDKEKYKVIHILNNDNEEKDN